MPSTVAAHGFRTPKIRPDSSYDYFWFEKWREFQGKLYTFASAFEYLVITDIANYYDNISFSHLRNVISSYGPFDEALLDFLFFMLEAFVWRPDYLPLSGYGLPQVNFDAPRLLAHCLLFEADKFLDRKTKGHFVRWMDDMDFGVDSVDAGKEVLGGLDELLLTRGLRLNLGKTHMLTAMDAREYLFLNENSFLSVISARVERKIAAKQSISSEKSQIHRRFRKFLKYPRIGRWSKVYLRYFTIHKNIRDTYLLKWTPKLLISSPDMREAIFRYYGALGPNFPRFTHLSEFYDSDHCFDDPSAFGVAKVLVDWEIGCKSKLRSFAVELMVKRIRQSVTHFVCGVWVLAKYASEQQLVAQIRRSEDIWKSSYFAARQVAAVVPLLTDQSQRERIIRAISDSGQSGAVMIVENIRQLEQLSYLPQSEKMYALHGKKIPRVFPLSKFVVSVTLLRSNKLQNAAKKDLFDLLMTRVNDPVYRKRFLQLAPG